MLTKIVITAALACLSLAAGARQYTVTLAQPAQVGGTKLAAGDYKVSVQGATATFTDSHRKTVTAPVKVEKVTKKSEYTAVETKENAGTSTIDIIDIGGADFKLVF
jgi:hypothetical protein